MANSLTTEKKLERLKDLMNIPQANTILEIKLEEWSQMFKDELAEIQAVRDRFGIAGGEQWSPFNRMVAGLRSRFRFEKEDKGWAVVPEGQPGKQEFFLFRSPEFREFLENTPVEFGGMTTARFNRNNGRGDLRVSIRKISTVNGVGIVFSCGEEDNRSPVPEQEREKDTETMEMFNYMKRFPGIKEHLLFQFRAFLKPNADRYDTG